MAVGNHEQAQYDLAHPDTLEMYKGAMANVHRQKLTINDHSMVTLLTVASDLSEQQRRDVTSNLT